jgi:ABC-type sulfate transport system permease component
MRRQIAGHLRRRENVSGRTFLVGRLVDVPMAMPIILILVAGVLIYFLFGRGGYRPPWDRYPSGRETEPPSIFRSDMPGGNQKRRV